jgi:hypothetical protein
MDKYDVQIEHFFGHGRDRLRTGNRNFTTYGAKAFHGAGE